eukprot:m.677727 g.677727  ORF g.677727 m.677727 type:complete len:62 (-) comp22799_c0_seq11:730-915(-)
MRIRHETLYQQYNRVPEEAIRNTLVSHFGAKVLVRVSGTGDVCTRADSVHCFSVIVDRWRS